MNDANRQSAISAATDTNIDDVIRTSSSYKPMHTQDPENNKYIPKHKRSVTIIKNNKLILIISWAIPL